MMMVAGFASLGLPGLAGFWAEFFTFRGAFALVPYWAAFGAIGIVISMLLLSLYGPGGKQLLGFGGSVVVLVLLGVSAGMFAIPVQVFIQVRPPEKQKGRMIAVMNLANFLAIFLAGPVYKLFDMAALAGGLPRSTIFAMSALLIVPVIAFYRPKNERLQ